MSKDAKPAVEGSELAPPKKSMKLLIIIVSVLVLVLGAGGAAAFLLMQKNSEHGDDEEVVAEKSSAKKKKGDKEAPPVYVPLEVFTVNLTPEQGDQFLQLSISVEVEDAHTGDRLKLYMPKLRNKIMLLLSDKKASELITKEGKEKLSVEIRDQMNEALDPPAKGQKAQGPIKEVLFTAFIIQ